MVGPAAKRARAAASFMTSTGTTPRSNGAPEVAALIRLGVESKTIVSLWPVACSKRGLSSFKLTVMEPPARTLSSAACAPAIGDKATAKPSSDAVIEDVSMNASRIVAVLRRLDDRVHRRLIVLFTSEKLN